MGLSKNSTTRFSIIKETNRELIKTLDLILKIIEKTLLKETPNDAYNKYQSKKDFEKIKEIINMKEKIEILKKILQKNINLFRVSLLEEINLCFNFKNNTMFVLGNLIKSEKEFILLKQYFIQVKNTKKQLEQLEQFFLKTIPNVIDEKFKILNTKLQDTSKILQSSLMKIKKICGKLNNHGMFDISKTLTFRAKEQKVKPPKFQLNNPENRLIFNQLDHKTNQDKIKPNSK